MSIKHLNPMLTNSTSSRITADAEAYAKKYNHFKDTTFAGMERQTYVEAASVEAERAQGLVSNIEIVLEDYDILIPAAVRKEIKQALTKYHNPK